MIIGGLLAVVSHARRSGEVGGDLLDLAESLLDAVIAVGLSLIHISEPTRPY